MKSLRDVINKKYSRAILGGIPLFFICLGTAAAEKPAAYQLDDLVITGTKTPHTIKDVPVETVVINQEDMEKSNAQNLGDVLKTIPGIESSAHDDVFGTYTWLASMRGLNFNDGYGLILIDGQRVMGCGQSGGMGEYGAGLNQIPVEMIERVEVVKGPSSALYGSDAVSGVINIITKKIPKKATATAGVAYGIYSVKEKNKNGKITKPSDDGENRALRKAYASFGDKVNDRIGYLIGYNYESAEDIGQDPILSQRHHITGKVDAKFTDSTDLFVKYELTDYEKEDNRQEDSYRLASGLEYRPNDNHFFSLKGYTYLWDFVHGTPGYAHGYKYGDIGFDQGEFQYTWFSDAMHTLTMGGEMQNQGIDFFIENSDGSKVTVNEEVTTSSLFLQDELTPIKDFTLVGGLRYDDHSTFGSEINPKLSFMYKLAANTTMRGSAGRAFKSPTIRQLYYDVPYKHGTFYCRSNPDLKPEIALGYSLSVEQYLRNDDIMLNIGYFRNDIEDMVIREDTSEVYMGLPVRIYKNVYQATTQGLELLTRANLTDNFSTSVSYTFTDSENKETGMALTYTPEHNLIITPAYNFAGIGLRVSGSLSYIGTQYTNDTNTSQIDPHTLLDAKISKEIGKKAQLSLELDNILDSDKGDAGNFRAGTTALMKLDVTI